MYKYRICYDFRRCLPEPVKAQEFLKKLTNHLYQDANIFALFERVADPDISCKDCSVAGVSICRKSTTNKRIAFWVFSVSDVNRVFGSSFYPFLLITLLSCIVMFNLLRIIASIYE